MAAPVSPNEPIRPRWTAPLCHEDVFVQRYQWLRGWAIRLTGNLTDADDLLHDAFLQFVLRRRDLSEIANFDAYLYGLLRRLRLSQRRALLRAREDPLTVVDYDTAELSLRAAGARDTLRVRDELRQVCAYACRRKDSARSGSVLLLRFFLGFFPGEIARIMSCPLRGANDWLRIARREARACLANPTQTPYGPPPPAARANGHRADGEPVEPLDELHEMIRASRRGECLSGQALARAYGVGETERLSCRALAHVVSCPECLSRVTAMLGMRGPSDRDPHDTLRQDTSWRFRRGAPPSADGPRLAPPLRRWESSLRTVREHEARELRVAANGLPLGACRISGTDCAFTVAVNVDEPLDFIEVFSEQGVRLMLWTIEPPPAGDVDQSNRIELGGGRSLSAAVHFDAHWPSLEIAYRDPVWSIVDEAHGERGAQVLSFGQRAGARARSTLWSGLRALLDALGASPRLRPALSAIVLLAAVMVWRAPWRAEPVSAAQILADARSLEIQTASAPHLVVHRVLQIEERRLPDRAVRMRRRVEGWHSASRGVTARRVYDERGRLVTAEWIRSDGTRTIYAAGQAPRVGRTEDAPAIAASSIWQWEPSAVRFEQLAGGAAAATVREERDRYVLTYRTEPARHDDGLLEATLVVSKDARRPIAQTIVIRERGEAREFHFAETARAELPEASVADSAFEPEAELLAPVSSPAPAPPSLRIPAARPVVDPLATAHLEVDVLFALHRLESCLDAPADIAPMADGTVAVTAVAAADECRGRVRRAIDDAERGGGRAVVTFGPRAAAAPPLVNRPPADLVTLPAYRSLASRFAAAGLGGAAGSRDDAAAIGAMAFGAWALEHARRAHEEALHLDRIATRWSAEALHPLDLDRVARWQDVVRDHARRLRRAAEALRAQLATLAPAPGEERDHDASGGPLAVRGAEDVRPAVARLVALAAAQHDAVRQMFDPELEAPRVPVDIGALTAVLRRAEAQAAWFDEPWTMGERTAFEIAGSARHMCEKAP